MPPFEPPERFNLADWLLTSRLEEGDEGRVALHLDDGEVTYGEVDRQANRWTRALRLLGTRTEDRVVVALPDGADFVGALFGILRAGAVVVMVNPDLPDAHLSAVLRQARPPVAVVAPGLVETYRRCSADLDVGPHLLVAGGVDADGSRGGGDSHLDEHTDSDPVPTADTHRDDPAIWLFSGGTTGAPKAVEQPHRSYAAATVAYGQRTLGLTRDDTVIGVPKLYFGYAMGAVVLFPLSVGGAAVLFPEPASPDALFDRVERHRATVLVNVPKMVAAMCDAASAGRAVDLGSLRLATSAGEALPPALYERWRTTFGVELLDGIGTAEMWHVFCTNRPGDVHPGTLGRAVEGYEVQARGPDDGVLAPGEVGRLWVRGPARALRYVQNVEASQRTFVGEWYATEDLVAIDASGVVTYVGRGDDAMKVGGKWLLPADVEGTLMEHDAVAEAVVVGAADEQGLTKPVAFVVPAEGAATEGLEAVLQQHVLDRLEPYKHPRRVFVVDTLPRTHLGKVDRRALRTQAGP